MSSDSSRAAGCCSAVPARLVERLSVLTGRIRSVLSVLDSGDSDNSRDSKSPGESVSPIRGILLGQLRKLASEVSLRVDTIREFVDDNEFDRLTEYLGISYDKSTRRSTVKKKH